MFRMFRTVISGVSAGSCFFIQPTSSKTMILGMGSIVRQFWPRCKTFPQQSFSQLAGVGFEPMTVTFCWKLVLYNQKTN